MACLIAAWATALFTVGCGDDGTLGRSGGGLPPADGPAYAQGHVVALTDADGEPGISAFVSSEHYDRCHFENAMLFEGDTTLFVAPARVGDFSSPAVGTSDGFERAGVEGVVITRLDEHVVEGSHDGRPFVLDTCGHFGNGALSLDVCELDEGPDLRATAVSPDGHVALADFDTARVYRPNADSAGCRLELDPDYGSGGVLPLNTYGIALEFDEENVLYAATTDAISRFAPGMPMESCRERAEAGNFIVLRDGSKAYVQASSRTEREIDLTSPALRESGTVSCEAGVAEDAAVYYSDALSVDPEGLLFLRRVDDPIEGPRRAEATDLLLEPKVRFGGTDSGLGVLGFADTTAGTRCPPGFCMASRDGIAVFGRNGAPLYFVRWSAALEGVGIVRPWSATEGLDGDAFFLVVQGDRMLTVRMRAAP